jgi:hypothetical protein
VKAGRATPGYTLIKEKGEEETMRETRLTMPELALIAATRGALGAGVALLLGERLSAEQRKAVGWTLFAVGAVTTIPLMAEVIGKLRER